jgi:pyruvate kinase
LQDLQGPKIRIGEVRNGQVELVENAEFVLTAQPTMGNQQIVSVDFPGLIDTVAPGNRILLDDGNLELVANDISGDEIKTSVVVGGVLKSHKGINLPGVELNFPGFTQKDESDLAFGLELGVDMVAVSFVRSEKDVTKVRDIIQNRVRGFDKPLIIAKLERPEAIRNLDSIISVADGVMVARGDLGVEMSPEMVPIAQKRIIESANRQAIMVITATQMLDSMIEHPRPTRAESSDVANAIFDGTDAVMLSGETAVGKYPVAAVKTMRAIIARAEQHISEWGRWKGAIEIGCENDDTFYMTKAAFELARDRNVAALAAFTQSGRTARVLSKTRPNVPILAFTPNMQTFQRLNLLWGVIPYFVGHASTIEEMLSTVESAMLASQTIEPGQQVVLICGYPIHSVGPTNLALLHTVGGNR